MICLFLYYYYYFIEMISLVHLSFIIVCVVGFIQTDVTKTNDIFYLVEGLICWIFPLISQTLVSNVIVRAAAGGFHFARSLFLSRRVSCRVFPPDNLEREARQKNTASR